MRWRTLKTEPKPPLPMAASSSKSLLYRDATAGPGSSAALQCEQTEGLVGDLLGLLGALLLSAARAREMSRRRLASDRKEPWLTLRCRGTSCSPHATHSSTAERSNSMHESSRLSPRPCCCTRPTSSLGTPQARAFAHNFRQGAAHARCSTAAMIGRTSVRQQSLHTRKRENVQQLQRIGALSSTLTP